MTGASGGVGSLAVAILARLGYRVVGGEWQTGGRRSARQLRRPRDSAPRRRARHFVQTASAGRWAGAVDTVGGQTLATILRSLKPNGCATACGLVGGAELPLTVYPFILRAASLVGIDSAWRTPPGATDDLEPSGRRLEARRLGSPGPRDRAGRLESLDRRNPGRTASSAGSSSVCRPESRELICELPRHPRCLRPTPCSTNTKLKFASATRKPTPRDGSITPTISPISSKGRVEQLRAAGYDYRRLEAEGFLLVVAEISCQYYLPASYDDLLTLRTITVAARGAASSTATKCCAATNCWPSAAASWPASPGPDE